jgi:hypothetical protein
MLDHDGHVAPLRKRFSAFLNAASALAALMLHSLLVAAVRFASV